MSRTARRMRAANAPRVLALLLAAAATTLSARRAQAQNPPPNPILDIASSRGGTLTTSELFTTSFIASTSTTTVSWAFREIPAYFAFDDASVTAMGSTVNLLTNPGFESATVGQNVPTGWGRFIQPVDVTAIGVIAAGSNGACSPNGAHGGTQFWCDGSVEGYDGLYQTIATTVGQQYNISFWLGDNSFQPLTNPGIDALVYAQAGLPSGTVPVTGTPEPATLGLVAAGLGLAGVWRRRRRAA